VVPVAFVALSLGSVGLAWLDVRRLSSLSRPFARGRRASLNGGSERPAILGLRHGRGAGPPERRWELDAAHGCDVARCAAFLDQLEEMPPARWLEVGRRVLARDPAAQALASDAASGIDGIIRARRLGVTAWLVRDAVETAALLLRTGISEGDRALHTAARRAAEQAALARLTRPWLERAHYVASTALLLALAADDAARSDRAV
jgi:hypothetical protein